MHTGREQSRTLKRLKKRSDFLSIRNKGQKWVSRGLVLQAMPNDLGHIRVGFTVTKRVSKSAVKRNRIKRRLRAACADTLPLYAKESCDYVLIGRPLSATRPYETLCADLKWCLQKMGFAKENSDEDTAD